VGRLALVVAIAAGALAAPSPDRWAAAKDSHFEVASETSAQAAQNVLVSFEQLRAFFEQNCWLGFAFHEPVGHAVRVVVFRSEKEYEEYRLRSTADAYYVTEGTHDYIVMASSPAKTLSVAAHEYAHYVLHAGGLKLPECLNEGLAEYFSTLRVSDGAYQLGGDLPGRTKALRGTNWLPLVDLFDLTNASSRPDTRAYAWIFYAESWALADMLATSSQYAGHFRELLAEFAAGSSVLPAFRKIYGKSLEEVTTDLRKWVGKSQSSRFTLSEPVEFEAAQAFELSTLQVKSLLAEISLVSGHLEQARIRYQELLRENPNDPLPQAALGTIAGRQGNREENLNRWREAMRHNSMDADLCYRYALLAEDAGSGTPDVQAALERAVELAPDFDEARYRLALIEAQTGESRRAVEQLRAMRVPLGTRRFAYWIAMAAALNELGERSDAQKAAKEAEKAAQTEAERLQARQLGFVAATDLRVQFVTDAEGHAQMQMTRVEHGATDFNPFIEPTDHLQKANGKLREVLCQAGKLSGFLLATSDGTVTLEVPDPLHVLIRNGPAEFYCGPMQEEAVEADYAIVQATGKTMNVVRGMTFQ
jgi:tetratricopeptide (TPR) repeat protein